MSAENRRSEGLRRAQDALERLYALWMISTLLLLLALVVIVFLMNARMAANAARIAEQDQRLARLERIVVKLDARAPAIPAERLTPATPIEEPGSSNRPATAPSASRPVTRPAVAITRPATAPAVTAGPGAVLDDQTLAARLNAVLPLSETAPAELLDPASADTLLNDALAQADRADWRGRSLAHLALLAHLSGREADADALLRRAAEVGDPGAVYYEQAGRRMLSLGRAADAAVLADRWRTVDGADPRANLLLAEAAAALDGYASAEGAVAAISDSATLSAADRLRLGRVYVAIEDWEALATVLDTLAAVDAELVDERDLLRAVRLLKDGKLTEALSILDFLAEQWPGNDDVTLWRCAVLVQANQADLATDALGVMVNNDPPRREAWYWLAMGEIRRASWERARECLDAAIAIAPRYAAAWEAAGIVELNGGEPTAAVGRLQKAVELHPRRASAHFLRALAEAKLGQREAAEAALRSALQLQPDLLDQALAAEALTRLIDVAEIRRMAVGSDAPAATRASAASAPSDSGTAPEQRDE